MSDPTKTAIDALPAAQDITFAHPNHCQLLDYVGRFMCLTGNVAQWPSDCRWGKLCDPVILPNVVNAWLYSDEHDDLLPFPRQ